MALGHGRLPSILFVATALICAASAGTIAEYLDRFTCLSSSDNELPRPIDVEMGETSLSDVCKLGLKFKKIPEQYNLDLYLSKATEIPTEDLSESKGFVSLKSGAESDVDAATMTLDLADLELPSSASACGKQVIMATITMGTAADVSLQDYVTLPLLMKCAERDLMLNINYLKDKDVSSAATEVLEDVMSNPFSQLGIDSITVSADDEMKMTGLAKPLVIMGIYNSWELFSRWDELVKNQNMLDDLASNASIASFSEFIYGMAMIEPMHEEVLIDSSDIVDGELKLGPNISLDLTKTSVPAPENIHHYMNLTECQKTFIVISLDPLHQLDDPKRENNIKYLPINRECNSLMAKMYKEMKEESCEVVPDYGAMGKDAILMSEFMDSYHYNGRRNSFRKIDNSGLAWVTDYLANLATNENKDSCPTLMSMVTRQVDSLVPFLTQFTELFGELVKSFEGTSISSEFSSDHDELMQLLNNIHQTMIIVREDDKLTSMAYKLMMGGGRRSHHRGMGMDGGMPPRMPSPENDDELMLTMVAGGHGMNMSTSQRMAYVAQMLISKTDGKKHGKPSLISDLSNCIRTALWFPDKQLNCPLCKGMSDQLKKDWAGSVSKIIRQESFSMPENITLLEMLANKTRAIGIKQVPKLSLPFEKKDVESVLEDMVKALDEILAILDSTTTQPSSDLAFYTLMREYADNLSEDAKDKLLELVRRVQGEKMMGDGNFDEFMTSGNKIGDGPSSFEICKAYVGKRVARDVMAAAKNWVEKDFGSDAKDNMGMGMDMNMDGDGGCDGDDGIRGVSLPTFWRQDGKTIMRGSFCPLAAEWFWTPVAKCSCKTDGMCGGGWGGPDGGWGKPDGGWGGDDGGWGKPDGGWGGDDGGKYPTSMPWVNSTKTPFVI